MKDVNDADIGAMVAFCIEHGFVLRLIEAMPMGDTGRAANYLTCSRCCVSCKPSSS